MRTEEEIRVKIKEFETQKEQMANVSQISGMEEQFEILIESIRFLDKNIALLKWVLAETV